MVMMGSNKTSPYWPAEGERGCHRCQEKGFIERDCRRESDEDIFGILQILTAIYVTLKGK